MAFIRIKALYQTGLCLGSISNYDCTRHLLGVGSHEFILNMTYLNGTPAMANSVEVSTGNPLGGMKEYVTIKRTALLDDEIVRVIFTIWK